MEDIEIVMVMSKYSGINLGLSVSIDSFYRLSQNLRFGDFRSKKEKNRKKEHFETNNIKNGPLNFWKFGSNFLFTPGKVCNQIVKNLMDHF